MTAIISLIPRNSVKSGGKARDNELSRIAVQAAKAGMSYGDWVARHDPPRAINRKHRKNANECITKVEGNNEEEVSREDDKSRICREGKSD